MAIISSAVSRQGSLYQQHRIFGSDFLAGMDNPTISLVDTGATGEPAVEVGAASWTNYTDRNVLRLRTTDDLNAQAARMLFPMRARPNGTSTDSLSIDTSHRYMNVGSYSLNGTITNRWNVTGDRLELFRAPAASGDTVLVQFAGNGAGSPIVRVICNDGTTINGSVDASAFLDKRIGMLVEFQSESSAAAGDGIVRVYMVDLSATTGLAAQRQMTDAEFRSAGTLMAESTAIGDLGEISGVELNSDAAGFTPGTGAEFLREVEAHCLAHTDRECKIDLDTGLGAILGYTELVAMLGETDWTEAVWVHCPPGRFDSTATEVWMRLQSSTDGSSFSDISGTDLELISGYDFQGAIRTDTLGPSITHVRAQFYDGDPAGAGTLIGSGPSLSKPSGEKLATAFCGDHSGLSRPLSWYSHAAGQSGVYGLTFGDDFGYQTGQPQSGNARCTELIDFAEVYAHILHDLAFAEAARSIAVYPGAGDHNWGLDGIDNAAWGDGVSTETRWDGTTVRTHAQITTNARQVWYDLFQKTAPNPQALGGTAGSSGYDYWWKVGKVVHYRLESVARRGIVSDSLASNSSTNYPGTSLDQEAAFGAAMANVPADGFGVLHTVRVAGPNDLTFADNWRNESASETLAGFARLVAQYDANAPSSAADTMLVVSGDRHICEVNIGLNGVASEWTVGPASVDVFFASSSSNNGAASVLTRSVATNNRDRVHGIIDFSGDAVGQAYETDDAGVATTFGPALTLASAPASSTGGSSAANFILFYQRRRRRDERRPRISEGG